jgi:hypothetical protein
MVFIAALSALLIVLTYIAINFWIVIVIFPKVTKVFRKTWQFVTTHAIRRRRRVTQTLKKHCPSITSVIAALFLMILEWFLIREFLNQASIGSIIWWWCLVVAVQTVIFAILLNRPFVAIWNSTSLLVKVCLSSLFTGWIWYQSLEASATLNAVYFLQGGDLLAARIVLTFLWAIFPIAICMALFPAIIVLAYMFTPLLTFILFTKQWYKNNSFMRYTYIGSALILYIMTIAFTATYTLTLETRTQHDVIAHFLRSYDFDSKIICADENWEADKALGAYGYRYFDANRTKIIRADFKEDKFGVINNRRGSIPDDQLPNLWERYLHKKLEILDCN